MAAGAGSFFVEAWRLIAVFMGWIMQAMTRSLPHQRDTLEHAEPEGLADTTDLNPEQQAMLAQRFEDAASAAKTLPNDLPTAKRLKLYALYKQAIAGDCSGSQPSSLQVAAAAKWQAWDRVRGMQRHKAMQQYAELVDSLHPNSGDDSQAEEDEEEEDSDLYDDDAVAAASSHIGGPVQSRLAAPDNGLAESTHQLHLAARDGELQKVEALLKSDDLSVDSRDEDGRTALHWACDGGHLQLARRLLQNGATPDLQDDDGATPLHMAVVCDEPEIVEMLLDFGASISLTDKAGEAAH